MFNKTIELRLSTVILGGTIIAAAFYSLKQQGEFCSTMAHHWYTLYEGERRINESVKNLGK